MAGMEGTPRAGPTASWSGQETSQEPVVEYPSDESNLSRYVFGTVTGGVSAMLITASVFATHDLVTVRWHENSTRDKIASTMSGAAPYFGGIGVGFLSAKIFLDEEDQEMVAVTTLGGSLAFGLLASALILHSRGATESDGVAMVRRGMGVVALPFVWWRGYRACRTFLSAQKGDEVKPPKRDTRGGFASYLKNLQPVVGPNGSAMMYTSRF